MIADREIQRSGNRMQKSRVGHSRDESQRDHSMNPPQEEVHPSPGLDADTNPRKKHRAQIPHGRESRERLGLDDPQLSTTYPVTPIAISAKENSDIRCAACVTPATAPAPHREHDAPDEKRMPNVSMTIS